MGMRSLDCAAIAAIFLFAPCGELKRESALKVKLVGVFFLVLSVLFMIAGW